MRTVFIEDLQNGQRVAQIWAVRRCEEKTSRNGGAYLRFEFGDRTGTISGSHFNPTSGERAQACEMEFCRVWGTVDKQWGLNLSRFPESVDCPADLTPFLPVSPVPFAVLTTRFENLLSQVREPQLATLLQKYFAPGAKWRSSFDDAPAAVRNHHAYRHGLLEHTIEVAEMALAMHDANPGASGPFQRDLLLTGALLHDIGKLREITGDACGYRFSTMGQLLGHTSLGMLTVYANVGNCVGSPLRELLLGMIASHHGCFEWGAPALPLTREGLILHQADHTSVQLYYADAAQRAAQRAAQKAQTRDEFWDAPLLPAKRIFVGDYGFTEPLVTLLGETKTAPVEKAWRVVCPWRDGSVNGFVNKPAADDNNYAVVRLPLLARVAAGPGVIVEADVSGHYDVQAWAKDASDTSHYLLRVTGDSMTRTGICEDDLIVVQYAKEAEHGDVVVATLTDGAMTVKRFDSGMSKNGPTLHAESVDTAYPSPFVPVGTPFRLEGIVRGVLQSA